jgi:hypothetical protein
MDRGKLSYHCSVPSRLLCKVEYPERDVGRCNNAMASNDSPIPVHNGPNNYLRRPIGEVGLL